MKNKIMKFLEGRYGVDIFGRDLLFLSVFILVLNLFVKSSMLSFLPTLISLYVIFRTLSKNFKKRYNENRVYTLMKMKLRHNTVDRIKYKYFRCDHCNKRIRVPRRKGKIVVTCPRCNYKFDAKT